jgi:hypothetical protein
MSYNTDGRRPFERASRSAHHHIVNDADVQSLLSKSWIPGAREVSEGEWALSEPNLEAFKTIEHVIAVDGSFTEAVVQPNYPSSSIGFMQFGALSFRKSDLERLDRSPHPAPEDMERLRNLERLKLAYPIRGIRLNRHDSLTDSIRSSLHDFFATKTIEGVPLADTLAWMLFALYRPRDDRPRSWHLATDPTSPTWDGLDICHDAMRPDFTFQSRSYPERPVYLVDVLRLHEKIDEETGAAGIVGHLLSAIEQLLLLHVMRLIHRQQPAALARCVFLRDGPLAYFGQTANLHAPYRAALEWLRASAPINLVGLEKSGAFVDHARQIGDRIPAGFALILNDDYIYRYIVPKDSDVSEIYGKNTYYGRKVIYRGSRSGIHVATIPTSRAMRDPLAPDLHGFHQVLACVDQLRCDMYDSALFPIALANKLVSLSAHPSQRILQRFATGTIRQQG